MLERICGLQLFQMDVSHQNLDSYRTLCCMVQWTEPVHNREDCSRVLDGVLDIRAQGGAFALSRLSISIKQRAAFFFF